MSRYSMISDHVVLTVLLGAWLVMPAALAEPMPRGDCVTPTPRTDLRHCDCSAASLRGVELTGTDLCAVNLTKVQLAGGNLQSVLNLPYAYRANATVAAQPRP